MLKIFENVGGRRMSGQIVRHVQKLLFIKNCQIFLYILSICRRMLDKILNGLLFPITGIRLFYQKLLFLGCPTDSDRISRLCLIFEKKTGVDPSDNVVQLIKAHSLHILFAIFEKIKFLFLHLLICRRHRRIRKFSVFCQFRFHAQFGKN